MTRTRLTWAARIVAAVLVAAFAVGAPISLGSGQGRGGDDSSSVRWR